MSAEQELERAYQRISELERQVSADREQSKRDLEQLIAGLEELETQRQREFNQWKDGVIK